MHAAPAPSDLVSVQTEAQSSLVFVRQLRGQMHAIVVNTPDEYEKAGALLLQMKSKIDEIEEKRESWTKPLNKTVKSINAFFKPVREEWEGICDGLKLAMLSYKQREALEKQQQLDAARALAAAGAATGEGVNVEQYQALVAAGAAAPQKLEGLTTRANWTWRVVDASKIPEEYTKRVIDVEKLNALAKEKKGDAIGQVPGIEFYNDPIIARTPTTGR